MKRSEAAEKLKKFFIKKDPEMLAALVANHILNEMDVSSSSTPPDHMQALLFCMHRNSVEMARFLLKGEEKIDDLKIDYVDDVEDYLTKESEN